MEYVNFILISFWAANVVLLNSCEYFVFTTDYELCPNCSVCILRSVRPPFLRGTLIEATVEERAHIHLPRNEMGQCSLL